MLFVASPRGVAAVLLLVSLLRPVFADVSAPAFFGSGMVLQRDVPLRIWGKASPGEEVVVELGSAGEARGASRAGADGRWRVELPARAASAEPLTLTVRGKNELRFDDVLVGDVWLCSGQSNMNFRLKQAEGGAAEVAAAAMPGVRLFTVAREVADEPRDDVKGRWLACSPRTAGDFSAVAYFFGKRIRREIGVPVGLIHSSWGGTAAEAWAPRATLAATAETRPILERWDETMADFPRLQAEFEANRERLVAEWKVAVEEAKKTGRMPPAEPRLRTGPGTQYQPAGLYHAMIAPLAGLPLRGVIWYQGEANAGRAEQYRTLFPAMIGAWRDAWGRADLPFLYVQLPNIDRQPEPSRSGWAELREAQLRALAVPNTGMAVTIDVGDPKDLHPTNKAPVGERLALVAEAVVYGRPAAGRLSPVFERAEADGKRMKVYLKTPDGLAVRDGGREPRGFVVAGADQVFHPASARIEADGSLSVWSEAVAAPVAVRYAWADNPDANLAGGSGLPASPFRSDDWPGVTAGRR
jgi:sialate O-acetylesterase